MKSKIAINYNMKIKYPSKNNFIYPPEQYEELPISYEKFSETNYIFKMVRETFAILEMDKKNYGTDKWNPLADNLIKEGDTVLIKPNMVLEKNQKNYGEDCLYTNPSVVAAVIPYVWKALKGNGNIIVADAPVQSCDFEKLVENSGYKMMIEYYKKQKINIELKDLRGLVSKYENGILKQNILEENDKGIIVNLDKYSEHAKLSKEDLKKVRITNYNPGELLKHHNQEKHEYLISRDVLNADVIINMPKPKAHRKAGVTISLKNFIGINTRKEYLPHHRFGDKNHGGDEYARNSFLLKMSSRMIDIANKIKSKNNYRIGKIISAGARFCSGIDKKLFSKEQVREGSWYGNDTIWRTIIDINKIVKYADKSGKIQEKIQRKIFNIADMIVVGEKEGPLMPSPKYAGMIAMGESSVCFDEIVATVLGFDINKIELFKHVRDKRKFFIVNDKEYGIIISNNKNLNGKMVKDITKKDAINIQPSEGWKNHIELER